jgi:hypothetical protein
MQLPGGHGDLEVFLPHEIYPNLVEKHGLADLCLHESEVDTPTGLGALLREWAAHPDVQVTDDRGRIGILGFHSDGTSYTTTLRAGGSKGVMAASLNIVSAQSFELRNIRQPLFVLTKARTCEHAYESFQAIMTVLAWSFECLASGMSPSARHDGSAWTPHDTEHRIQNNMPLPRAALLQVRGDWENMEQMFRVRSVKSDVFCWMCDATLSSGQDCFLDFREEAHHRRTLITHQDYLLNCAVHGDVPSNLFASPGLELKHLTVDCMHAGDLGCFQDVLGSLFFLEVDNKHWYNNRLVGLKALNKELDAFYTANRDRALSRCTPLTIQQIIAKKPGYPYLKCKAAATRHLVQFGLMLALRHRHGGGDKGQFNFARGHHLENRTVQHLDLVVATFEGLAEFHDGCEPFDAERCKRGMLKYLQNYESLWRLWRAGRSVGQQKPLPFHMRQKAHALHHLVLDKLMLWGSPSRFFNYRDEDYIGVIKVIAGKTKHPRTLERRVSEKLLILSGLNVSV